MLDSGNDECLRAKVADCDGRGVVFAEGAFGLGVEDGFGEDGGAGDC